MIHKTCAALIAGCCWIVPALADETPPDTAGGRYTLNKVADGFVRLDTRTGEVALCSKRAVGWACQAAPEDRAVLEQEIARLRADNVALKQDLLSHGLMLPSGAAPEPPLASDGERLPPGVHADLDRMVALFGHVWHRLVEAIAQAQHQLNKS